jgi:hypothetical protein
VSEWTVLIRNHHPGFVEWETFEANQRRLAHNAPPRPHQAGGAVREGAALLHRRMKSGGRSLDPAVRPVSPKRRREMTPPGSSGARSSERAKGMSNRWRFHKESRSLRKLFSGVAIGWLKAPLCLSRGANRFLGTFLFHHRVRFDPSLGRVLRSEKVGADRGPRKRSRAWMRVVSTFRRGPESM